MTTVAAQAVAWGDFSIRLCIDLVAISLLAGGLYLRRHARGDLFVVCIAFNIGVFVVLAVITTQPISTGVGFGLFAILSIIRLRSETFNNTELAYAFSSLAIGVVDGFERHHYLFIGLLDAIVLVVMLLIDQSVFQTRTRRRRIILDTIATDAPQVRATLGAKLGIEIVALAIDEIDYVRETTTVTLRYVADSASTSLPPLMPEPE